MDVARSNSYNRPQTCRFFLQGRCRFGQHCRNLHPNTLPLRRPTSFRRSNDEPGTSSAPSDTLHLDSDKSCGICFDVILNKAKSEQVFGILPNCNHCFCFTCIRKWRSSKEFNLDVSKACPECRVSSDFVYPSRCWMHTKEEKDKLISERKSRMAQIDCKYFRKGRGKCPFGNVCLYQHKLPNGKKVDVGPPLPRRNGSRFNLNNLTDFLFYLTNYTNDRNEVLFYSEEDERGFLGFGEDFMDYVDTTDDEEEDEDDLEFYAHQGMLFELL